MSKLNKVILACLAVTVVAFAFAAGFRLGGRVAQGATEGLDVVDRAWSILFEDYVDKSKLDPDKMKQAAIEGMIKVLDDPYTSYLSPANYRLMSSDIHGRFEGIGAHVGMKDNRVTIIAPIPGSPAEKAGIRPGDTILAVDGVSTLGLSLNDAVLKIRGPRGTTVKLQVQHVGESQPTDIEIVRDTVTVNSVYSEMKGDIAYINISQFAERTDAELIPVLQGLSDRGARGIILDLRRDPGGLLDTVISVASHFIKEGVIVKVRSNQDQMTVHLARQTDVTTDLPMVVLVDAYSASGSEVLSGALQDYKRATIAGAKTYGKGSVNTLYPLKDGSGLYITTARWLTPNGRLIEGKGIEPDYLLELQGEDAIQWAIDYLKGKKG